MQVRRIEELGRGFIPFDSNLVEEKTFLYNKPNELFMYREKTVEHYLLVSGEICVNGVVYDSGTVLTYHPFERRNYFVLEDVIFKCFKESQDDSDDELKIGDIKLDDFVNVYHCDLDRSYAFNDISSEEITVVLQGAVDYIYTPLSIESIRRFLPGAKIVLSTWEHVDKNIIDYDELVVNEDPGAPSFIKVNGKKHVDNRNRLLVSTKGGIKNVTSKYTLKMRSDCILVGDGIVRNFGRYNRKTGELGIFENKLVIGEQCNILKLHFKQLSRPYLFHLSDWFVFGLSEDVKTYFLGTEVESDDQMLNWTYKNEWPIPEDDLMGRSASPRYNSEQYFFVSALKRKHEVSYDDASDYSECSNRQSEMAIVENFEILNIRDHQIVNAKKQSVQPWDLRKAAKADYLTNSIYEEMYSKYTGLSSEMKEVANV